MKLNIGENIRKHRKTKNVTQEEFAELLGVSFQSVSRWENGTCYPDLELLPVMADFFGVTVDQLIGADKTVEQAHVGRYLDRFRAALSQGRVYDCIAIARAGVAEYPNNYALLNKLMYALFLAGDDDGNIPEWEENMKKYDAEITALGERIMKHCPDQEIRLEATARLAFHHCEMGRRETGRAIYETLPSAEHCREQQMWWGLTEEERLPFTRERIRTGFEIMAAGLYSLLCYGLLPDEQLIKVFEKRKRLYELIYDGSLPNGDWGSASFHHHFAKLYLRLGKTAEAFDELNSAARCALAFDARPEETALSSLLLGDRVVRRSDFETDDTRPLAEIMRDKWLAEEAYDSVRETKEFEAILARLTS